MPNVAKIKKAVVNRLKTLCLRYLCHYFVSTFLHVLLPLVMAHARNGMKAVHGLPFMRLCHVRPSGFHRFGKQTIRFRPIAVGVFAVSF